jgi:large subunit ribosomal protein L22
VAAPATTRTNERPGTRAVLRHTRMSASKARVVLDLIRGKDVRTAEEILQFSERDAAIAIRKLLRSAVANAEHNDEQAADELFVSACFADEGRTLRRYRPRARGRATRIRKRTCHVTVIVSRMPEEMLERRKTKEAARPGSRAARVAAQQAVESGRRRRRRRGGGSEAAAVAEATAADQGSAEAIEEQGIVDQQAAAVAAAESDEDVEEDEMGEAEAAEEAGIVDQQAAAVEGVTEPAGAGGSAEAELAAADADAGADEDTEADDRRPSGEEA